MGEQRRWWNHRYGRVAQRRIWLDPPTEPGDKWAVTARIGDGDAAVDQWKFACEPDALAHVDRLIETGGDGWTEIVIPDRPNRSENAPNQRQA